MGATHLSLQQVFIRGPSFSKNKNSSVVRKVVGAGGSPRSIIVLQGCLVLGGHTWKKDFLKEVREQIPEEVGKGLGWAVSEGITEQEGGKGGSRQEKAAKAQGWEKCGSS